MSGDQLQLWEPQQQALDALQRVYSQEPIPEQPQIVQMPTGCGKSLVAALLPRYLPTMPRCTVLVVVPSVALVAQMKKTICALYTKLRIDGVKVFVSELTSRQQIFQIADRLAQREQRSPSYNFFVCNIHKLCQFSKRWQSVAKVIDVVVIDEAHHMPAKSWQQFLYDRQCLGGKVKRQVLFTATPFRTDQRPLSGQLCFAYPYRRAIELGLIRHPVIHSRRGGSADQDQRDVDLLRRTETLLGGDRQAIGCASSVADAERIAALARQHTRLSVDVWHSRMGKHEQARVRKNFEHPDSPEQRTDMLLQVNMCSEGYDHPPVSVITFFRVIRSPLYFIQAVGRASRRSVSDRQRNAYPRSFIVSDDRLNARALWQHFKQHVDDDTIEPLLLEGEDAEAASPEDVRIQADAEQVDSVDVEDTATERASTDQRPEQRARPASSSSSLPVGWWTDPFDATLFSSGTTTPSKPRHDEDEDLRQKRDLPGPRSIESNDGRKRARTSDAVSLADRASTVIEEKQRALEQARRDLDLLRTAEQQLGRSLALL